MKTVKFTGTVSIILGIFLLAYATNQFLHIVPTSYGKMPQFTQEFLDAVAIFLPALYIFEIILGITFIIRLWGPLITIVLAPLSVNFLIFNILNGGWNLVSAAIVAILNLILIYQYRDRYKYLLD